MKIHKRDLSYVEILRVLSGTAIYGLDIQDEIHEVTTCIPLKVSEIAFDQATGVFMEVHSEKIFCIENQLR